MVDIETMAHVTEDIDTIFSAPQYIISTSSGWADSDKQNTKDMVHLFR